MAGIKRHKVQINFKSGKTLIVKASKFTVRTNNGEITRIEWENITPKPLHLGADQVESIWQVS